VTLLGTTLDLAKELGEVLDRLVRRVRAFGLDEIPHERSPEPLVDV
jgi:hypothetical protein